MLFERMRAERSRIQNQLDQISHELKNLPEGKIICAKNQNNWKWYHSDGKSHTYIPKSQRSYAEKLAVKKYLSTLSDELSQEKKAIDSYLRHHDANPHTSTELLTNHPGYHELLNPYFSSFSQELSDWTLAPYEHNQAYPEHLKVKTSSGIFVRSKSEALIDMVLYKNRIPFRYECALHLDDTTLFPDFTIKHPETGELFYWEHFGKMDEIAYCKNSYQKLYLYSTHGIFPSINLIVTLETLDNPLSSEVIEKLVEHYFL